MADAPPNDNTPPPAQPPSGLKNPRIRIGLGIAAVVLAVFGCIEGIR